MYVKLNDGYRLFVDTIGSALSLNSTTGVIVKRSIIILHGGPGMDHMVFRPHFDRLGDYAQAIYIDQRGCGRSDAGSSEQWNLNQWADDVADVIGYLGLVKPIIIGTSFGGIVAQRFASRHPEMASGLVLQSTASRCDLAATLDCIESNGGIVARQTAEQFFTDCSAPNAVDNYFSNCLHLYTYGDLNLETIGRVTQKLDVMLHFFKKDGEFSGFDTSNDLKIIDIPTLIVHGEEDPIFPIKLASETLSLLESREPGKPHKTSKMKLLSLPKCGHLSEQDASIQIIDEIIAFFDLS